MTRCIFLYLCSYILLLLGLNSRPGAVLRSQPATHLESPIPPPILLSTVHHQTSYKGKQVAYSEIVESKLGGSNPTDPILRIPPFANQTPPSFSISSVVVDSIGSGPSLEKAGIEPTGESFTLPASVTGDNRRRRMSSADRDLGEVAQLQMYFDIGKEYVNNCLGGVNPVSVLEGEASYVTPGIDFLVRSRLLVPPLS